MSVTDQMLLDKAKDALLAILSNPAASYTISGRTYTGHNINDLRRFIERLEAKIAHKSRRPAVARFNRMPGGAS